MTYVGLEFWLPDTAFSFSELKFNILEAELHFFWVNSYCMKKNEI